MSTSSPNHSVDERIDDDRSTLVPPDPMSRWPQLRRIGVRPSLIEYVRDIWERRDFALTLPLGELRAQNQNTALGQLWHLLNPLLLVAIFYLVFGVLLGEVSRGFADENYVGFLVVGIMTFTYTQKSIQAGARIIVSNQRLVQTINFPRAILPLSAVVGEFIAHLPALGVMFALLLLTGEQPGVTWLMIVPIVLLQSIFNLGVGFFTARLTFHFRDVTQLLPYIMRLLFYISGVIFAIDAIEQEPAHTILRINPFNAFVEMARDATMELTFEPFPWIVASIATSIAIVSGLWFFRQAESEYGRV